MLACCPMPLIGAFSYQPGLVYDLVCREASMADDPSDEGMDTPGPVDTVSSIDSGDDNARRFAWWNRGRTPCEPYPRSGRLGTRPGRRRGQAGQDADPSWRAVPRFRTSRVHPHTT